jgi:NAD(P) transhydrogenase subunit alpha
MSEDNKNLTENAAELANQAKQLADQAASIAVQASESVASTASIHDGSFFLMGLTVFVLACFVGYYVVWRVTPALHSPLMGITNAISSVIIVGALIAAGPIEMNFSKLMGFFAVILASINIFGGFIVTQRMLHMFKKKVPQNTAEKNKAY